MLHPGVTQEWVDEGELPRERTKNRRWRKPYEVLAEATHGDPDKSEDKTECKVTDSRAMGLTAPWYHRVGGKGDGEDDIIPKAKDHGGIVYGNATQVILSLTGQDHAERQVFCMCASKLASDESLGHQHMGVVYHRERNQITSTSESHGGGLNFIKENRIGVSPVTRWRRPCMRVTVCLSIDQGELLGRHSSVEAGGRKGRGSEDESSEAHYLKGKRRLERRLTWRSTTVPKMQIYRSRRKGYRCKATDSRAMGLAAPWYRRGGTSMESSIPCSHGGRALVIKGTEEVENTKANSKYQDRVEGRRPRNFIRLVSMDFSSREPKARDFGLMQEYSTKERSR
ncbi:hypothetical protein B296_00014458 [Ensete ventricosum]|uniref:Uncharacterized protein n=1 Tax=Ensete ventricosum TaxID=4639 RepID=A0A426X845_ENSVE|nr:hypothetical protein B296_00014458 [Ensete ventricosum]